MSRFTDWFNGLSQAEPSIYIVAEMANAHEGSLENALSIVKGAAQTGVDAIKFQCFTAEELLVPQHHMYSVFQNLEMSWQDWRTLIKKAKGYGLDIFCDVFGFESASQMMDLDLTGFKVHASDVPNKTLLRYVAASGRPIFLSSGGVNWVEIADALDTIRDCGESRVVLINGIQRYPTDIGDSNLLRLKALAQRFDLPVGYADHLDADADEALWLPYLAVAAGSRLIEKHITLDRSAKGTDYYSSLNVDEFTRFVAEARKVEKSLGRMDVTLSEPEQAYRNSAMKSLVAARPIEVGARISEDDVTYKRVDGPVTPVPMDNVVGRTAGRSIEQDQPVQTADLSVRIFASLACRAQSLRLYGKPLQLVGDRPILKHLIDRLGEVQRLDGMVLAISEGNENLVFVDLAGQWDLPYIIGDQQDVLGRHIEAARSVNADIILRVTTENPFVYQENLDLLVQHHLDTNADLTVCELLPDGSYSEVINVSALERSHRYGEDRHRSELCSLFIFENPDVFKIEKVPAPPDLARPDIRLTIDTPEDLMLARRVYEALEPEHGPMPTLSAIIKYLDSHEEVKNLNADLSTTKLWR